MSELDIIQFMAKAVQEQGYDVKWLKFLIKQKWNVTAFELDTTVPKMVAFKVVYKHDLANTIIDPNLRVEEIDFIRKHVKYVLTY